MNKWKFYRSKYKKSWKKSRTKPLTEYFKEKRTESLNFPKKITKRRLPSIIISIIGIFVALSFAGIIAVSVMFVWIGRNLPDPSSLSHRIVPQSTKIYDRTGQIVLYDVHGEEKRTSIPFSEIPNFVKQATLIIEDREFYQHKGINWKGIFRATIIDLISGKKEQGGSSITQQLVKNSILSNEKTFTRKIKELILSYKLEAHFTKDEILEMYFNEIPYGSTIYGIEAASQSFFGKKTKDLNLAEAAVLASIPKAPTYYSPYGNHREELLARAHYILDEMARQNLISQDELKQAKDYKVLEKILPYREKITAPHFVMYVKDILTEKYGEKTVEQGGLKVITTLDVEKQKIAEEAIDKYIDEIEKQYNATNAALVSIDAKTGQILAMVGSRDFFEPTFGSVNVTLRPRQPGSSFKPVVYAAAFLKGYTPSTILYDVNTVFKTLIEGEYSPKNYDEKEHGPLSMKKALAGSLNIPAVKTLYLTGIDRVLDLAEELGYTTFGDRSRFGLSLVLGGGEVKLLEHTNAFGVFLREGKYLPATPILKIEDSNGNTIEEWKDESKKVLDEEICRNILDILSDNESRAFIFGVNNYLVLDLRPAAAKTGTTNDFKDAWTIGGTPSLVTGVWAGNNNSKEMKKGADGSKIAAPIWNYFMTEALKGAPVEEFAKPLPIITNKPVLDGQMAFEYGVQIDKASGKLATQYTPKTFIETKTYKEIHNVLYYVNKDDPRGPSPSNPETDEQFDNWEAAVKNWALNNNIVPASPPREYDDLHIPSNFPTLEVLNISSGMTVANRSLEIETRASAPRGLRRIEVFLDNQLLINTPYSNSVAVTVPSDFSVGSHILKISVFDDIDNTASKEFNINLSY
jgi:1A family penicillin-binding protein